MFNAHLLLKTVREQSPFVTSGHCESSVFRTLDVLTKPSAEEFDQLSATTVLTNAILSWHASLPVHFVL